MARLASFLTDLITDAAVRRLKLLVVAAENMFMTSLTE